MSDHDSYERRAREAEELAALVSLPQNRRRYLAIASAWRAMIPRAPAREADGPGRAA